MSVEIKICGLTDPDEALACVAAGADAIGLVFYPPSPRHLDLSRARAITAVLPAHVARVGVFVDADAATLLHTAVEVGLTALQLHGAGSLAALPHLLHTPYRVIAVLCTTEKLLETAAALPSTISILVECGRGVLPGGNGAPWKWADTAPLAAIRPFAVAGGITPDTVAEALQAAQAAAVDVSSGVESRPGRKDPALVGHLIRRARAACAGRPATGSVFHR